MPAEDHIFHLPDGKIEPIFAESAGALLDAVGAVDDFGFVQTLFPFFQVDAVHLLELLQGGGVLTLHARGVKTEIVERLRVGNFGREDGGFDLEARRSRH